MLAKSRSENRTATPSRSATKFDLCTARRVALDAPERDDLRPLEREVWQVLREARNAKARAMERSMFIVCNDRTLCEMVRTVPACLEELQGLYGMGEKKLKAHGQMLLDALAPHTDGLRADHDTARREDDKRRGTDMAPTD